MVLRLGTANFENLSLPLHVCFLSSFFHCAFLASAI
jgi:hypothetical protein